MGEAFSLGVAGAMAGVAWFLRPLLGGMRHAAHPRKEALPAMVPPAAIDVPLIEPVPSPGKQFSRDIPASVLEAMAVALAQAMPPSVSRTRPTPLGDRVLSAMIGQAPIRKCDVAALVGIGRGSANRTVDALVRGGWLREAEKNLFALI